MVQIIKKVRGYSLEDLNEQIVELGIKREDVIKHDFFYVNSHDSVHQILYWAEQE